MVSFTRMLNSVLLAVTYASLAQAFVETLGSKRVATHSKRTVAQGLQLEIYHPEPTYQTFGEGIEQQESLVGGLPADAVSFVQSQLQINGSQIGYKSGYQIGDAKYAYVRQLHDNIPFVNAVANVGWNGNKVVAFGSSFVQPSAIAPSQPTFDLNQAITKAEGLLDGKHNDITPTLEYLVRPNGTASLVHVIQIQNEGSNTWYEAFVDAHSGDLISITDFVAKIAYKVLPISKESLPEGQEILNDPFDRIASPSGWHNDGKINTTITAGNNVVSFTGSLSGVSKQSSPGKFVYNHNDTIDPTAGSNIDAARVNAFYIINSIHDYAYRYGFTEAAYNFQNNNFGKHGKGNDRVQISVQDDSGMDNANFATPPDGQNGVCRMYIFDLTTIRRDGALQNDIVTHEMTHGITNRMTGGGTARCLQTDEAGGMGEGWSDTNAFWAEQKSAVVKDYVLGPYVLNDPAGVRTHPYSTSKTVNPDTYSTLSSIDSDDVHRIGEVWANTLVNVYAALVAKHGFNPNAKTSPGGTEGNVVFFHLFIDSLPLQPCEPTFLTARSAWIQADQNRYKGANKCLLWAAFASRGLGPKAANYIDDFTVPAGCPHH
ncbi:hypothetical protein BDN72DRAFT_395354 [Pluteus cervinus]|uniref:Uncharacterized protein n=1 Tax=Pluteus cervinus TaxID=181527 RepID=A0ACD3A9I6_9AGAR|nr:hypothetical protein BDN72DRAFT_395354 [Pluteus cervinus]